MLLKFFPRMESLETYLRKYKREITLLTQENAQLEERLDAAKPRIAEKLEAGKLQQEVHFLRKFYENTPDEYKEAYHTIQQSKQER